MGGVRAPLSAHQRARQLYTINGDEPVAGWVTTRTRPRPRLRRHRTGPGPGSDQPSVASVTGRCLPGCLGVPHAPSEGQPRLVT